MLVRIVKDWEEPDFFQQIPNRGRMWDGIEFTSDKVDRCDYLIVLQRPHYDIEVSCQKGNTWLITQEPPIKYFRFQVKSFKYFDKVFSYYKDVAGISSMQPVLPWHVLRSYDELSAITRENLRDKNDEVVWITSNKSGMPGHKARMTFLKFLQAANFEFHLFGRGFTPVRDKFDKLFPSKYAIAIENFSREHYWTEKIADCFLSWSLPFYWGAPNLEEYFPADSFIRIDVSDPGRAMRLMQEAITNNEWEKRLPAIEKARNLVLNQYQFFPYVAKMIRVDSEGNQAKPRVSYRIPANPFPGNQTLFNHIKYYTRRIARIFRPKPNERTH